MSQRTPGELADIDAFECRNCGYIHTKHDGTEPNQCVDCGAQSFRPVDENATNRSADERGFFAEILNNASAKELILYLIFIFMFFGSLIVTLTLFFL